ncbi:MAG: ABC transporter ATP-binding protein [Chloroflexia bacterium]|nr:ABC transporter ATP-binding protein [Chloroflexia bacterium]
MYDLRCRERAPPVTVPAIHVNGLTKRYPSGTGVHDLSFSVPPGELFVFLGPNGAGKSSTIKMLTGLLAPSDGVAEVNGVDVVRDRTSAKRQIGYMAEQPFLYEKLTGREFVTFVADVYRVPRRTRIERSDRLLQILEMSDRADHLIETYSLGMRQKIAIASVLVHQPPVLFLDEPTNGLDPRSARTVKDLLRDICARGGTVFMTTHILEIAEQMCDRVGILDQGRLVAIGTIGELRDRQGLPDASLETIFLDVIGYSRPIDFDLFSANGYGEPIDIEPDAATA